MTSPLSSAVASVVGTRRFVVALGGGADSATLLHTAASVAPQRVRAVFVNQGLAGSDLLERAAEGISNVCGVDLTVLAGSVDDGPNLEARARVARYLAMEADLDDDELALTGHTADDQAETVLMRLLRGSGAGGLSGIPAERGPWRRPFLGFSRDELRVAAGQLGLPFADDPANSDERFLRSRIRMHLIPLLEESYAPGVVDNLGRSGELLAADDAMIEALASDIEILDVAGEIAIPLAPLLTADTPVASRVVRGALRRIGDDYPGSMDDVNTVLRVATSGRSAHVSGRVAVKSVPPFLVLRTGSCTEPPEPVAIGDIEAFMWGEDRYRVSRSRYPTPVVTTGRFSVVSTGSVEGPVEVRSVLPGDRIDLGNGATPVTEVLRDAGVPANDRQCWPLVTVGGMIAGVHGVRNASWATPHNGDTVLIIEREVHT